MPVTATCPTCDEEFSRPPSTMERSDTSYCSSECWYNRNATEDFFDRRGEYECWPWVKALDRDGYGQRVVDGESYRGHRLVYQMEVGPIPEGKVLHHVCENPSCCNPNHLEPVTQRENILQGNGTAAKNARKTHCKHGHEFTEENTYTYQNGDYPHGRRQCKTCIAERAGYTGPESD